MRPRADIMPGMERSFTKALETAGGDGNVRAVIATLGQIDRHSDIILPGFIGDQATRMVWHHDAHRPVGRGRVFETDSEVHFEGQFFTHLDSGREAYELVKAMGDLQEWSFGFYVRDGAAQASDVDGKSVTLLKPLADGPGAEVVEVSPVMVGAGVGTRTLALKSHVAVSDPERDVLTIRTEAGEEHVYDVASDGTLARRCRLTDEVAAAARGLEVVTARLADVMALRAEKDRTLGDDTRAAWAGLTAACEHALALGLEPTGPDEPDPASKELWRELMVAHLRDEAQRQGFHHLIP